VRGKRLLLVLDNCEHLLDACGPLVEALPGAGDDVRLLASSRRARDRGRDSIAAVTHTTLGQRPTSEP
jgi:non-specific serine/threonine protein kinase